MTGLERIDPADMAVVGELVSVEDLRALVLDEVRRRLAGMSDSALAKVHGDLLRHTVKPAAEAGPQKVTNNILTVIGAVEGLPRERQVQLLVDAIGKADASSKKELVSRLTGLVGKDEAKRLVKETQA